jgi:hypothetical protein
MHARVIGNKIPLDVWVSSISRTNYAKIEN